MSEAEARKALVQVLAMRALKQLYADLETIITAIEANFAYGWGIMYAAFEAMVEGNEHD